MAQLKELKIMFKTGDLTGCEIDQDIEKNYMLFVFSKSGNEWIALETQRTGNINDDYRRFTTLDAAIKVAQSIGFKGTKLVLK